MKRPKKQFICFVCDKPYMELEEAEVCERSHAMAVVNKTRTFFAHCDKCDHLTSTSQLGPVMIHVGTYYSPAEYEEWCEQCRGIGPERDDAYERAADRDRADNFARTGGKDWT